jgi:hypothetical protein
LSTLPLENCKPKISVILFRWNRCYKVSLLLWTQYSSRFRKINGLCVMLILKYLAGMLGILSIVLMIVECWATLLNVLLMKRSRCISTSMKSSLMIYLSWEVSCKYPYHNCTMNISRDTHSTYLRVFSMAWIHMIWIKPSW